MRHYVMSDIEIYPCQFDEDEEYSLYSVKMKLNILYTPSFIVFT